MKFLPRIPFITNYLERRQFRIEMDSLNKRFEKQDALWEAIELEEQPWMEVEFYPTFVDSDLSIFEGFVKSDGVIVKTFSYQASNEKLTVNEINENNQPDWKNHQTREPLEFDYPVLDGWYEHSEGWNNQPGCAPSAAVGYIEDNGAPIAEFAFCPSCRKLEIKPIGFYLGNLTD